MLQNMAVLTNKAKKEGFGIAAVCPMGIDQIAWSFEVAASMRSPLIICNNSSLSDYTIEEYGDMVSFWAGRYPEVLAALCLDHGENFEHAARGIKAGYTCVMVDKSMCSDDENIRAMKEVVKLAHASDVAVEAGLGGTSWRDPTPEDILAHLTKVDSFKRLVTETEVDAVAVFVGGSHGDNKKQGETTLHYDLVEALRDAAPAALVMHGSSGTGDDKLAKAAKCGISKFNVAGDLFMSSTKEYAAFVENDGADLKGCIQALEKGFKKRVAEYLNFLGSADRC